VKTLTNYSDKTGQLAPSDPAERYQAIQWLIFQVAGIGPIFGQVGYFVKFAGKDYPDKRPRDHYIAESKCLLVAELAIAWTLANPANSL
jgi:GSH-dependent disulfide-bond oxidoreductase